jgi:hypothetical protein
VYDRKKFHIDHIIAEKHGGLTVTSNLAMCCTNCNFCKGPNLAGIDPKTQRMTRLFSPRRDQWKKHFAWDGALVIGLSSIGRATVAVLNMNSGIRVRMRAELISVGLFPTND